MRIKKLSSLSETLSSLSLETIQNRKEQLYRLGSEDKAYKKVKKAANKFLEGHSEWIGNYNIDDLYRGRKWNYDDLPKHVNEMLAPKPEQVKSFGRLNPPHNPRLYLSETVQTIYNELNVKKDDKVVILRLHKKVKSDSFFISHFGSIPPSLNYNELSQKDKIIYDNSGGIKNFKKLIKIRKDINHLMRLKINNNHKYLYKITAALVDDIFNSNIFCGVLYPSVASKYILSNLALSPSVVGEYLLPHSAALVKIEWYNQKKYRIFCEKTAKINKFGKFIWDDSIIFDFPLTPEEATKNHKNYYRN